VLFLLAACQPVTLRSLEDGSTVAAELNALTQSITLTLPEGEVAAGHYRTLTTEAIGEGSLFFGANVGQMLGRNAGVERFYGHVRAVSVRGTVVEMVFASGWTGHGHGVARTTDGHEFTFGF
jgi:hypothetical protein